MSHTSWSWAVELTSRFVKKPARLSHLLERLPVGMDSSHQRRCRFLLTGVIRNLSLLESVLDALLRKRPRPGMWASLLVAEFEIMEEPDKAAKIVDHAIGQIGKRFSPREKAMANAVLRKAAAGLEEACRQAPVGSDALAVRYSHLKWRVERWLEEFGLEATTRLLQWNALDPDVYFFPISNAAAGDFGTPTPWSPYRKVSGDDWRSALRRLDDGEIYIQNPAARLAPEMIADRFEGGSILDLCAAPGGKSLYLEQALNSGLERIVSVDLPGPRFDRLAENLDRSGSTRIEALASDLFGLDDPDLLGAFQTVLLDAPCSNSGVIQKKPDVKWRFSEDDLKGVIALQKSMIEKAASFVSRGGLLVYSTCSIDSDENEAVVAHFLKTESGIGFKVVESKTSLPWETPHDGAGVHLLRREA